ncbi:MAG: hypothetical protein HYR75_03990, partial [Gemmatimonadetes bacterium]|nr:hypothetical protein [Gemmatimonadota bacterium]
MDTTTASARRCRHCGADLGPSSSFCSRCGATATSPVEGDDPLLLRLRELYKGEYEIDREIGRGGMAAVFAAFDPALQRRVAIKALLPGIAAERDMGERFLREARTVAALQHPHVVTVYGVRADDATRHFANMRAAAEAGLAPAVRYTSSEDKVSITDFVNAVPLPASEALSRLPAVLRSVHALPPFATVPNQINTTYMFLMNKGPALDAFLQRFRAANLLPANESEELFAVYEQVSAVYPHHDADMVSSHNDLFKPDNMLFDGQRLWLVDWEA